jgi:hypothetical protein
VPDRGAGGAAAGGLVQAPRDERYGFSERASDDGVVRVWYAPGGDFAHAWPRASGSLHALAVSAKSGLLADAGAVGDVRLSSPGGEVIKRLALAAGALRDLSWSPAGDLLAAACNDGTVRLLELPD